MEKIAEKKRKPLDKITQVIEQYDFYFKNIIMNELVLDQSQDKRQNLRSIIQLNFELKQVKQARVDKEFENQLQQTFVGNDILEHSEGVVVNVEAYEALLGRHDKKGKVKENEKEQLREIQRVCFFELKLFAFLMSSLNQVQINLRNITALWAKDLGLDEYDGPMNQYDDEGAQVSKVKNTKQDIKTYQYLMSLANFIEVERVTLECFRSQMKKNVARTITKKLEE